MIAKIAQWRRVIAITAAMAFVFGFLFGVARDASAKSLNPLSAVKTPPRTFTFTYQDHDGTCADINRGPCKSVVNAGDYTDLTAAPRDTTITGHHEWTWQAHDFDTAYTMSVVDRYGNYASNTYQVYTDPDPSPDKLPRILGDLSLQHDFTQEDTHYYSVRFAPLRDGCFTREECSLQAHYWRNDRDHLLVHRTLGREGETLRLPGHSVAYAVFIEGATTGRRSNVLTFETPSPVNFCHLIPLLHVGARPEIRMVNLVEEQITITITGWSSDGVGGHTWHNYTIPALAHKVLDSTFLVDQIGTGSSGVWSFFVGTIQGSLASLSTNASYTRGDAPVFVPVTTAKCRTQED